MKIAITYLFLIICSSAFAAEGGDSSVNLGNQNLAGLKMNSVNFNSTIEFGRVGFKEVENSGQFACSGTYSLVKNILGTSAENGKVFLKVTDRKCTISESENLISYYIELPMNFKLDTELAVIGGGLIQESEGRIQKALSLEGTGDYDGVTFTK
jgi:hypothetical protein